MPCGSEWIVKANPRKVKVRRVVYLFDPIRWTDAAYILLEVTISTEDFFNREVPLKKDR